MLCLVFPKGRHDTQDNDFQHNNILNVTLSIITLQNGIMLSVVCSECCKISLYAECRYAECRYAECRYAECRYAECRSVHKRSLVG